MEASAMENLLSRTAQWENNPRVQGTYYGVNFKGQVMKDRWNACGYMQFHIKLDSPISVLGQPPDDFIIIAATDETPNTLFSID
jgi:hypothetical protein